MFEIFRKRKKGRVLVIGLDSAPPQLVFDRFRDQMPNIRSLMDQGIYGELESTIPAITVPAWISMMTGKDPGQLGIYGFRNRLDHSYDRLSIANSTSVRADTVWDILASYGKKSIVIGVPPSYPPKPIDGYLISCFLTPNANSQYTYPPELKTEIENLVGEYPFDVEDFRTEEKGKLLEQIYQITEKHFRVVEHLLRTKEWDLFMFMEISPDRIHHGFWKYFDKNHRKYQPGNPYENAIRDYYGHLDEKVGELLSLLEGDTAVLVVSDHGAKRLDGGICVNEWLMKERYLHLRKQPQGVTRLNEADVDWQKTIAWGEGGYHARIFLNVKGREPQGRISPEDYGKVRDELAQGLESVGDENGKLIGTRVFKPQQIYRKCWGIPPDLLVYFGNLYWRSVGSIGLGTVHTFENDTGPDDANHDPRGIFILYDPARRLGGGRFDGLHLMDVAPTVLELLNVPVPGDMVGKVAV